MRIAPYTATHFHRYFRNQFYMPFDCLGVAWDFRPPIRIFSGFCSYFDSFHRLIAKQGRINLFLLLIDRIYVGIIYYQIFFKYCKLDIYRAISSGILTGSLACRDPGNILGGSQQQIRFFDYMLPRMTIHHSYKEVNQSPDEIIGTNQV